MYKPAKEEKEYKKEVLKMDSTSPPDNNSIKKTAIVLLQQQKQDHKTDKTPKAAAATEPQKHTRNPATAATHSTPPLLPTAKQTHRPTEQLLHTAGSQQEREGYSGTNSTQQPICNSSDKKPLHHPTGSAPKTVTRIPTPFVEQTCRNFQSSRTPIP